MNLSRWRRAELENAFRRPYPILPEMILLMALVPVYLFIGEPAPDRLPAAPELAIDRWLPLQPAWALVYGALYLFLIVLPILVVREREQMQGMFRAYLLVWCAAYLVFWRYPTVAPRPADVTGKGFAAWGLRFLYAADPPRNCFPSLHVAHSFVSALAVGLVDRWVGRWAILAATLVALSTLLTKQHYAVDVVAGVLLAFLAGRLFLRHAEALVERSGGERPLALALLGAIAVLLVTMFGAYRILI